MLDGTEGIFVLACSMFSTSPLLVASTCIESGVERVMLDSELIGKIDRFLNGKLPGSDAVGLNPVSISSSRSDQQFSLLSHKYLVSSRGSIVSVFEFYPPAVVIKMITQTVPIH